MAIRNESTIPPCQPANPVPAATAVAQAAQLVGEDVAHGPALHDEVGGGHEVGVGVGLERPLDDDVEVVLAQERHEQLDGLLGRVPVPPATDDEGSALLGHDGVS